MKKKMMTILLVGMMVLAAGCGNGKVVVGEYKGLALTSVSQEDVDKEVQTMLTYYTEMVEVDRAAAEGDTVNIDYVGTKDGEAFEGGTAEGYDLELGSDSFIDGFEDGLIGAVAGEVRDLNLVFPENYTTEELKGQAVVFKVTVNSVKEKQVPELTDEFISETFGEEYSTVDAYLEALRESLNYSSYYDQITELLMASSEVVKYNEKSVEARKETLVTEAMAYAEYAGSYYGMDTETAIKYILGYESAAAMEEDMKASAYDVEKNLMIITEIADIEKIELTKEEYDTKAVEYATAYGYEDAASFIAEYGEDTVREAFLTEKVMHFLVDNAVIAE